MTSGQGVDHLTNWANPEKKYLFVAMTAPLALRPTEKSPILVHFGKCPRFIAVFVLIHDA